MRKSKTPWRWPVLDPSVTDGDTIVGTASIAPRLSLELSGRVIDVDAPEKSTQAGKLVKQLVERLVSQATAVMAECHGLDKYGRMLVSVEIDGVDLAGWLLDNQLADHYDGGMRAWTQDGLDAVAARAWEMLGQ